MGDNLNKKTLRIVIICVLCVLANFLGRTISDKLNLFVWLDAFGTVFAACLCGPVCGALVGAASNVAYGLVNSYALISYAAVSVIIGVVVGGCHRKGYLDSLFGILSTAFFLAVVSTIISVPFNFLLFNGSVGNVWGDGVVSLLVTNFKCNRVVAAVTGQFYIDFVDKTLTVLLVMAAVRHYKHFLKKCGLKAHTAPKPLMLLAPLALALLSGYSISSVSYAYAADNKTSYNTYVQTIYNSENGLPGGSANDIAQTGDGIIWIGTYGGLYTYDGRTFTWVDEYDSVKNAISLYTDDEDRLWVGTNDSGLSIISDRKIAGCITEKDGLPSDSVRCIVRDSNGLYYVGTSAELSVVELSDSLSVKYTFSQITYVNDMDTDLNGHVAAVTNSGMLYVLNGESITDSISDFNGAKFTCVTYGNDGALYAGTADGYVVVYKMNGDKVEQMLASKSDTLLNIQSVYITPDDTMFVCADNGVGYMTDDGAHHSLNTNEFNNSIDHCMVDYQGNIWFTSSRLGLLNLSQSVFTETYYEAGLTEKVVNTVAEWNGRLYFGTDVGVDVVDMNYNNISDDNISAALENVRVRNLTVDSHNNLWIGTTSKGLYCAAPDGSITHYDTSDGLIGQTYRTVIEYGSEIVAAGNSGISYIKGGAVTDNIGADGGLANPVVLCLLDIGGGKILAGTDGGGVAVIEDKKVTRIIGKDDGLSSGVILRIVKSNDYDCIYIVTSNSICCMNGDLTDIRVLDRFPYNNNYDCVISDDGTVFVLSSAGIYVVEESDLLADGEDAVDYKLFDAERGFKKSLTPNAWNYIDDNFNLYLATDTGVVCMNLKDYDTFEGSYKMMVNTVIVDGEELDVSGNSVIHIPRDAERVEIVPQVINYAINTPYVYAYLEGIDGEPDAVLQSRLNNSVYTNLPVGTYTYHLAVLDSMGHEVVSEVTYTIVKDKEIYDNWWFYLYAVVVFAAIIAYLTWLFFRTQIQRTINVQKRELQLARDHAEMGNETVLTIARTVDAKDENTSQHSYRVSEYSVLIARKLGFTEEECENLRKAALLHDIGKIGIPDSVLNKPGKLTEEEYDMMKSHVVKGGEILSKFKMIDHVAEGALYHHERYDGTGYVHGLKGEEIPLYARIIGIADAFDAMTANRVYRKRLDIDYVLRELKRCSGTQFDPKLVTIMLDLIERKEIDIQKMYE